VKNNVHLMECRTRDLPTCIIIIIIIIIIMLRDDNDAAIRVFRPPSAVRPGP
jgi:hypothetical protein